MQGKLNINPRKVAGIMLVLVIILELLHLVSMYLQMNFDFGDRVRGEFFRKVVMLFDMNSEQSVPAFYSSTALLFASCIALFIAWLKRSAAQLQVWYWYGISFFLVFMALDESASIHEMFDQPAKTAFNATGYLSYAWIIPYGMLTLVVALIYLRFLLSLPRRTQIMFVSAATVFVTGAIGMESIGGKIFYQELNKTNKPFLIVQSVEEILEKLGVIIAIYAMLDYLARHFLPVDLRLRSRASG